MHNFEYVAPRYEAEVVSLLSPERGRTAVLAGGTDLLPLLKKMIATPDRVVNVMEVPSLKQIELLAEGWVKIGAAVTLDRLLDSEYLRDYSAVLQAVRGLNSMQLQCQGTVGGDLCQRPQCWFFRNGRGLLAEAGKMISEGDNRFHAIFGNAGPAKFVSASRLAPALVALGARMRIIGPEPEQETMLSAEQFYRTPQHERDGETVLRPNELLAHIYLPQLPNVASATYEVRQGAGPDDPLATASVALEIVGGTVLNARIVMGQVAPTPWRSTEAEAAIVGRPITTETAEAAGQAAVASATPLSNNGYKVQLAKVAVKRALLSAAGLETGGH
jgi:xanthine dehydrogenase YagS FAD-binding subunit